MYELESIKANNKFHTTGFFSSAINNFLNVFVAKIYTSKMKYDALRPNGVIAFFS